MISRRNQRWNDYYTYFFGNLSEEEMQYRDYFESELEADPENEWLEEQFDKYHIANIGDMNPQLYDFTDYTAGGTKIENYDDLIEDKLFKFKYRQNADDPETFEKRNQRVIDRFFMRANGRDRKLEQDLQTMLVKDLK